MHVPVLQDEVLRQLRPKPGGRYLDATVGLGGHAEAILQAAAPTGTLVGIDADGDAVALAARRLAVFGTRAVVRQGRYEALGEMVGVEQQFDGILFDLGASSLQLDAPERGFSFTHDGPLDMRMDRGSGQTAAEIVGQLPEGELADLIFQWGEERWSRRIARAIVAAREEEAVTTTAALAAIVARAIPRRLWPHRIHPATRTFQALRIAVNRELVGLEGALADAARLLAPHGRAVVISFHSLEDRIVKQTWRRLAETGAFTILTKRPLIPGEAEHAANPRSRSAKLRAVERLAAGPEAI